MHDNGEVEFEHKEEEIDEFVYRYVSPGSGNNATNKSSQATDMSAAAIAARAIIDAQQKDLHHQQQTPHHLPNATPSFTHIQDTHPSDEY